MPLALPDRADAVLLDLDGVLVDSRRVFVNSLNAALEGVGLAPWPVERLLPFLGPPLHGTVAHLLRETGEEARPVVATSKVITLAEPLLEEHGLRRWFAAVAAPAPEAREESKGVTVGQALGELPDARAPVMIGDRHYDVHGAGEHGVPCVG